MRPFNNDSHHKRYFYAVEKASLYLNRGPGVRNNLAFTMTAVRGWDTMAGVFRHFQMHFLRRNYCYFDCFFTEICLTSTKCGLLMADLTTKLCLTTYPYMGE